VGKKITVFEKYFKPDSLHYRIHIVLSGISFSIKNSKRILPNSRHEVNRTNCKTALPDTRRASGRCGSHGSDLSHF
jgi:hypothetical protein